MHISVIIPTHDRSDHLAGALDTVAAQTLAPVEVVVVDDLPTGEARATVNAWRTARSADGDDVPPVSYVENPDGDGPSGSRNLGAGLARGDWLAFLDDDDRWDPDHLQQVAELGRDADVVLCPLTRTILDAHDRPVTSEVRTIRPLHWAEDIVGRNPGVTGSNLAITRKAFTTVGGYDVGLTVAEDTDLLVRIIRAGLDVVVAPTSTSHQLVHRGERLSAGGSRRLDGMTAYLRKYYPGATPAARRRLQFRYWSARKDASQHWADRLRYRLFEWSVSRPADLAARVTARTRMRLHERTAGERA